jgi:hypothetical protein
MPILGNDPARWGSFALTPDQGTTGPIPSIHRTPPDVSSGLLTRTIGDRDTGGAGDAQSLAGQWDDSIITPPKYLGPPADGTPGLTPCDNC